MGTAEVMALIRASAERGFAAQAARRAEDAVFRPARLEDVRRLEAGEGEAFAQAEGTAEVVVAEAEILAPEAPSQAAAVLRVDETAQRMAEARAEGQAEGHARGLEEGRATGLAEGHAKGLEEGRAEGRAEAEAELGPARAAFTAAVSRLAEGAGLTDDLAGVLAEAVRRLAAERAGQMIDALPAAFAARVERMADRVAQGVRAVSIRLNPDDLAAITPHLAGCEVVQAAALIADARLARGDVEVRAEGIRLADLIGGAA